MDERAKLRRLSRLFFSGPIGRMSALTMEKHNLAAEREAVKALDPEPTDAVLAIGFGPGAGIEALAERLPRGTVGGIDPSSYMVKRATRRNRAAVAEGRVRLTAAYTDAIPWPDDSFDAAIAVNTVQFWQPVADNVGELARVLRPGARLVTFTHDWALAKVSGTVAAWTDSATAALTGHGFGEVATWNGTAENGRIVALCATRRT